MIDGVYVVRAAQLENTASEDAIFASVKLSSTPEQVICALPAPWEFVLSRHV